MKILILLLLTLTEVSAAASYGGVHFHSTVESIYEKSLKNDLRYIYRSQHRTVETDLSRIMDLKNVTGPTLHNWLINRVKFIVGESYILERNLTVLQNANNNFMIHMTNIGASLYQHGKTKNELYALDFDGKTILLDSPRTGVIQMGEGLFDKKSLLNTDVDSAANIIQRVQILFHEARHSDGNGKHLVFPHMKCPKGHAYEGSYACESVGNGPYSVGAHVLKQFRSNCTTCSTMDKALLDSIAADNLNRILYVDKSNEIKAFQAAIKTYENLLTTYHEKLVSAQTSQEKMMINKEIAHAQKYILYFKDKLAEAQIVQKNAPLADPRPEGIMRNISLSESQALMEKSLSH